MVLQTLLRALLSSSSQMSITQIGPFSVDGNINSREVLALCQHIFMAYIFILK